MQYTNHIIIIECTRQSKEDNLMIVILYGITTAKNRFHFSERTSIGLGNKTMIVESRFHLG